MVLTPDEYGLRAFLDNHGPSSLEHLCKTNYTHKEDMLRYLAGLIEKGYAVFDEKEKLYKLKE